MKKYKKKKLDMIKVPREDRSAMSYLAYLVAPEIINVEKVGDIYNRFYK